MSIPNQDNYNPNVPPFPQSYGQAPVAPKKGKKALIIATASVLTVGLLGGGAFLTTNLVNGMNDKDISVAMPGSTAMFGEVDLNPSNEQKLGVLALVNKVNAISKDETVKETKDPKEIISEEFFGELDFKADVEPWMGDKVAVGYWGDIDGSSDAYNAVRGIDGGEASDNNSDILDDYTEDYTEDYDSPADNNNMTTDPDLEDLFADMTPEEEAIYRDFYDAPKASSNDKTDTQMNLSSLVKTDNSDGAKKDEKPGDSAQSDEKLVFVYEIKDKDKAEEAIKKTSHEYYVVTKDYLAIANSAKGLDSYKNELASSSLKDNKDFKSDRKTLNIDSIAMGWADLGKLGLANTDEMKKLTDKETPIEGRFISGLTLEQDKLSNVNKLIGFNSELYSPVEAKDGLDELSKLPGNSMAAISLGGLDASLKEAWKQNKEEIEGSSSWESIQEGMNELDITLPEDFTKVLGSEIAVGLTVKQEDGKDAAINDENISVVARLAGADEALYNKLIDEVGEEKLAVKKDGSTVVLSYQDLEDKSKLGDNDKFKKAVGNLKNSQSAGYVNIDSLVKASGSEDIAEIGYIGFNGSYDKDKNVSSVVINWVY